VVPVRAWDSRALGWLRQHAGNTGTLRGGEAGGVSRRNVDQPLGLRRAPNRGGFGGALTVVACAVSLPATAVSPALLDDDHAIGFPIAARFPRQHLADGGLRPDPRKTRTRWAAD